MYDCSTSNPYFDLCNVQQIAKVLQRTVQNHNTIILYESNASSLVLIVAICCRYQFNQWDMLMADNALQQQREWGIKKLELGLSLTREASLIQVCPLRAGSLHWRRGHTKLADTIRGQYEAEASCIGMIFNFYCHGICELDTPVLGSCGTRRWFAEAFGTFTFSSCFQPASITAGQCLGQSSGISGLWGAHWETYMQSLWEQWPISAQMTYMHICLHIPMHMLTPTHAQTHTHRHAHTHTYHTHIIHTHLHTHTSHIYITRMHAHTHMGTRIHTKGANLD